MTAEMVLSSAAQVRRARFWPHVNAIAEAAVRHPLLTVALVAATARLGTIAVIALVTNGTLIPDSVQYIELARGVSEGRGADSYKAEYGPVLYRNTLFFTGPLAALFWLFGPSIALGATLAAAGGVLTAVLGTVLALRALPRPWALAVGGLTALWPSQIFWSAVVLRESFVWAAVVTVAIAMAILVRESATTRSMIAGLGLLGLSLIALAHLREQTLIVVAWAAALVALALPGPRRWTRAAGVVILLALVPLYAGLGVAGWSLVERSIPALARTRAELATGADSAIIDRDEAARPPSGSGPADTAGEPGAAIGSAEDPGGAAAGGPTSEGGEMPDRPPGSTGDEGAGTYVVRDGHRYLVEEGTRANLRHLPAGIAGVLARPYPWESHAGKADVLLAKLENVGWYVLYALAIAGVWFGRRSLAVVAFPGLATLALVASSALSQGNAGTAFRHRGQVFWALALLAGFALNHYWGGRSAVGDPPAGRAETIG